jgi:hypothetical protein
MGVEGYPGVWALGDCAMIPDEDGGYQPSLWLSNPVEVASGRHGMIIRRFTASS